MNASRQLTPRNIRSLILRYQLARNMVRAGADGTSPDRATLVEILEALIGSTFEDRPVGFCTGSVRQTVGYIVAQVS